MYHQLPFASNRRGPNICKCIDVFSKTIKLSHALRLHSDLAIPTSWLGTVCWSWRNVLTSEGRPLTITVFFVSLHWDLFPVPTPFCFLDPQNVLTLHLEYSALKLCIIPISAWCMYKYGICPVRLCSSCHHEALVLSTSLHFTSSSDW